MKRIHIPNTGPDELNIPVAISVALMECKTHNSRELAIITPIKNNLDSIVVGDFLGQEASKRLMKGGKILVGEHKIYLSHYSVSTAQKGQIPDVGLAFYVSGKDIKTLDGMGFSCLIYVPWLDDEGKEWALRWGAETHGGPNEDPTIYLLPEVLKALSDITNCINLSTGLAHPSDRDHARRKFSQLRSANFTWNPTEIEKWAVRNGWNAADAEELSVLSKQYI